MGCGAPVTAQTWWLIAAGVIVGALGYWYSLRRNPTRRCHACEGSGKNRAWVWSYATGDCTASTILPPRARCDGGRVPRYGRRLLRLEEKK